MNKLTTCFLIGLSTLASLAHAEARFSPHNLFIKMKPGQALADSTYIQSSKKIIGDIYLVKTANLNALSAEMSALSSVEYVEKDHYVTKKNSSKHETLQPDNYVNLKSSLVAPDFFNFNDPLTKRLWAFNSKAGMKVSSAYDILPLRVPQEIIVAVVDTGVDHKHEDLKDIMWRNEKEIPGNGIDDDNNGYIDDIHGINTLVRDSKGRATMNTMASHWHGTHVAGTIAATQNNGLGIAGVANNVKIMAIRTVPDDADELDSDIVEAFVYAQKNGAKIINCSFGKQVNEGGMIVRDTIDAIGKKGVLVVAAAGNDESNNDISPKYPAAFDSKTMMVIAATDITGAISDFSNFGYKTVDVAAPGSDIYSTINNNKYEMASGTSMATPNAVGVAAMVLGYFPKLKPLELKNLLMNTADKIPAYKGKVLSGGRINMKKALEKAQKL